MTLAPTCSAVILTGGLNTPMQGRNKAFLQLGGHAFDFRLAELSITVRVEQANDGVNGVGLLCLLGGSCRCHAATEHQQRHNE